jgi:hypothetical protein
MRTFLASPSIIVKKCRAAGCHRRHQQVAIEKKIPHLATGFGDQQTSMAGRTVSRPIPAAVIRLVIGTYRIVGADP